MRENHLMHYASKYYDPVKAHEYYIRNRELKGRQSSSKLNETGKEQWSYAKEQIKTEKNQKIEEAKTDRDSQIEELRAKAAQKRESITAKLKELNAKLSEDAKTDRNQIDVSTSNSIDQLRSMMKSNTMSADRKIEIQNKINDLRENAEIDKANVTEETKAEKTKNSEDATTQRQQVASELKSSITAAREAYKLAKENIDVSYEEIYQQEFDKILAENPAEKKNNTSDTANYNTNQTKSSGSSTTDDKRKEPVLGTASTASEFIKKRYSTYKSKNK